MTSTTKLKVPKNKAVITAGFGIRLLAYLIDTCVAGIVAGILSLILEIIPECATEILFKFSVGDIFGWLATVAYFAVLTWKNKGQTLGKMICSLHVVNTDDTQVTLLTALYRESIGRYLSGLFMVGYFMAMFRQDHKALHDVICDTKVIQMINIPDSTEEPAAKELAEETACASSDDSVAPVEISEDSNNV